MLYYPFLITGAGPVGLTLAIEIARRDGACRIVDKASEPSATSKALAIFPRTLEVFESMGVVDPVLKAGHKLHHLTFHGKNRTAVLSFADVESPYPFAISLPQSETERILTERLKKLGVTIERNTELTGLAQDDDGVSASLKRNDGEQEMSRSAWLIGCDGAHSAVRKALPTTFEGAPYDMVFGLADVSADFPFAEDGAHLFLHHDGAFGVFPFGHGRFRLVADLPKTAPIGRADPTLEDFQRLVEIRGPSNVVLKDPTWLAQFHISHRKVRNFRNGRVFLAGDAAHIHSPAGGQGMNTGIQDAFNLGWKLSLVESRLAGAELLDSYSAEREPVARAVLNLTDRITQMAFLRNPLSQTLLDLLLPLFTGIGPMRHWMANTMTELAVGYHDSPIVAENWRKHLPTSFSSGPASGDRAPNGHLIDGRTRNPVRLFELFHDERHALLLFLGKPFEETPRKNPEELIGRLSRDFDQILTPYVIFAAEKLDSEVQTGMDYFSILLDPDGAVHQRYGAEHSGLYLIRPDGHVAYRSRNPNEAELRDFLHRIHVRSLVPANAG